jgi:ABC-type nitrate/sulfonate/bicarbonate transport system substrate-binding protein
MPPSIRVVNGEFVMSRHWRRRIFPLDCVVLVGFAVVVASKIPLVHQGTLFMAVLAQCLVVLAILTNLFLCAAVHGAGPVLIAYGGFNETMAPMWVGVEKGLFKNHGVDARVLQTRSGQIMMATLATGGASLVWAAPSSALNSSAGGMKVGCFAAGNNKLSRELIVRKGIESIEDLRGKSFGVQSIGGGAWLSTMVSLDALGLDVDKYKLSMRVIGDTGTQTQALLTGNIDAAMLPYSYAEIAKRAGARSLADVGALKVVYQATVMCSLKDSSSVTLETYIALAKGLIESLLYILAPTNRREVAAILKRNLRLAKDEEAEASVRVAQLQMPNVEIALNTDSWKTVRRLVARINPKVQEVDLDQVIVSSVVQNLETSGFLPEMRKRIPR